MRLFCLLILLLVPSFSLGHSSSATRVDQLTEQLLREPDNAALYLARGNLYVGDGKLAEAMADFADAGRDPKLRAAADLARGEVLLRMGAASQAVTFLDRLLSEHPRHFRALRARARAHAVLGDHLAAATDLTAAMAGEAAPKPDDYLDRAQMLIQAERLGEAVASLDEGIARLGPVASLVRRAVEIELQLGRTDAVLGRLERIEATDARGPWASVRLGLLRQLGRDSGDCSE